MGTPRADPNECARQRAVLVSVGFSVTYALACSRWAGSDGRSAVVLNLVNLLWLGGYVGWRGDRGMGRLLGAAGVFGLVELVADFLCVHCTGTLDYAVARSAMVLASPWWMPFSWGVVAVQVGVGGAAAIRRLGLVRGALLTGLLGALLIPFYEEMAWGANWWRYRDCLTVVHTPVYIVLAEGIIGAGLALLGYFGPLATSVRDIVLLGVAAGLVTVLGGVIGWGTVEFIGRGARPTWVQTVPPTVWLPLEREPAKTGVGSVAAERAPRSSTVRPMASSRAVEPRGT